MFIAFTYHPLFQSDQYFFENAVKALHMYRLREKCPYPEFFCSVLFRIPTEYGGILRISLYSVQMRENTDQNNSEYEHFLLSDSYYDKIL